jgi:hypothetical protein
MHHLLLGIDPFELGQAPFALATSSALNIAGSDLSLGTIHDDAQVYILPCIAGHVGADAAAVALSEEPGKSKDLVLVVDVGTNAEILLGNTEKVLACSSPTGPAFEGAQISSGQRAAPGAIERVEIDPVTKDPRFKVIGCDLWSDDPNFADATAATGITGICGSGIIEMVAEMRMHGIVDGPGLIGAPEQTGTDRCFLDGRTYSYLVWDGTADGGPRITVTNRDIREIQMAKAALYSGARLLMDKFGVDTRHGSGDDPRLRVGQGHLGWERRRHRRAYRPSEHRRAGRDRRDRAPDPQDRDRHRTPVSGAFRQRLEHPQRGRTLSDPRQHRHPADRDLQHRRRRRCRRAQAAQTVLTDTPGGPIP